MEVPPIVVRLLGAHSLPPIHPSYPKSTRRDVYVTAELRGTLEGVLATARWPIRSDPNEPRWNSCRSFTTPQPPSGEGSLMLRLRFYDEFGRNDVQCLGTAEVPVTELDATLMRVNINLGFREDEGCAYCELRREDSTAARGRKVMYIVRHGESVWNRAQTDQIRVRHNVEHPLNAGGRAQAESLRAMLREPGDAASDMLAAEEVWCSPLTRGVVTALIGLEPFLLPAGAPSPVVDSARHGSRPKTVVLNPNLCRSGRARGDKLVSRAHTELLKLLTDDVNGAAALCTVPLETKDVQNTWWLGSHTCNEARHIDERIDELLHQLCHAPAQSLIAVGHSSCFFRMMCLHLNRDASRGGLHDATGAALTYEDLTSRKLANLGVAKVTLDFDVWPEAQSIVGVQLLFGTQLESEPAKVYMG